MAKRRVNAFTILVILVVAIVVVQSGQIRWYQPTPVFMLIGDGGGALTQVASTWQEWSVQFKSGSRSSYRSDLVSISFALTPLASDQPSVLDITFKTRLDYALRHYCDPSGCFIQEWKEFFKVNPIMTVLIDGRNAGSLTTFSPIIYSTDDAVGSTKTWQARVLFQGTAAAGQVGYPTLDLSSSLIGKDKALVQVVMTELWVQYKDWIYSASTVANCGITIFGQCLEEVSTKTASSPYGLNFVWTPSATGTASFNWPTAIATTDASGNPILIYTKTGTDTVTLWESVTATLAGPTAPVTITVGTSIGPGNQPSGPESTFCSWIPWLCGTTFGIPNWALLALGVVLLLLLFTRKSGGQTVTIKRG